MFTVKSDFIGHFKIGDNINHNLDILSVLYRHFEEAEKKEKELLCKPIIIFLVSIADAIVYDLFWRVKAHTIEGVPKLTKKAKTGIILNKFDRFHSRLVFAKKNKIFGTSQDLYSHLEGLIKLRNRIHIQNEKNAYEANEIEAFTIKRKRIAETAVEKLMRLMTKKFKRKKGARGYVRKFQCPWPTILSKPGNS